MHTEKMLPVKMTGGIYSECWHSYIVAALLSDDKYLPWFVERFMDFYVSEDCVGWYRIQNVISGPYYEYEEVIDYQEIRDFSINPIQAIQETIIRNRYVISVYNFGGVLHEIMIIGYDAVGFQTYRVELSGAVQDHISYETFLQNFTSALEILEKNSKEYKYIYKFHMPLSSFGLKPEFHRAVRLERLEGTFYELHAAQKTIKVNKEGEQTVLYHGTSILDFLIRKLQDEFENDESLARIIRILFKLWETSEGLRFRVDYCTQRYAIDWEETLPDDLKRLCDTVNLAKSYLIKYQMTRHKRLVSQATKKFLEIRDLEETVFWRLFVAMEHTLLQNIKKDAVDLLHAIHPDEANTRLD